MKSTGCIFCLLTTTMMLLALPAYGMQLCDYDLDWDVDGLDLSEFAGYFAVQDPAADVDDSGTVDDQDLSICSQEFGHIIVDDVKPVVLVANFRENSLIKTGFIIGSATDDDMVTLVEIKLDNGDFMPATGTDYWTFQLPIGTDTWRDDSRHTIQVRARDRSGNYSDVTTLSVRKGTNKDINGDGYADLVSGASGTQTFGHVYVYHGASSGVSDTADTTITGEVQNNSFGDSLALGDVNGDGYADLVIGNYGYDSSHGRVWIFHGSAAGIADTDLSAGEIADTTLAGEAGTSTNFGSQLAYGDVNGDGYADLAVEAPGWYGKIHIFHGGAAGIPNTDLAAGQQSDTTIVSAGGGELGSSVKFGDVNGDGYADLAVGARGYSDHQGRAYIFYGGNSGIADTNLRTGDLPDTALTGIVGGYGFGYRLAFGDANNDGYSDLAVAAAWDFNQGYVYVFHGSPTGIPDTNLSAGGAANTEIIGINERSQFGYALVFGDITADGYDDLAVGARLYNLNQGRVYLFHSSASGIGSADLSQDPADGVLTGETTPSTFGQATLLDDFNGDGNPDLAVSGDSYNYFRGRVYVFNNTGITIPDKDLSSADSADTTLTGEINSSFGEALAD
ncbi:MAG: FG-GAP repeat protein [Desulfobacterales bacterium]|nr:MAG: FG-GAP repeat protein [Desulfobacterales bacterium]